jgi:hypothetical protein
MRRAQRAKPRSRVSDGALRFYGGDEEVERRQKLSGKGVPGNVVHIERRALFGE